MRATFLNLLRWALAIPSPSLLALGKHGPAERRYLRLRAAGKIPEAFPGADALGVNQWR